MNLRTWLLNWRAELAAAGGVTLVRQFLADDVGWDSATAGITATLTLPRLRPATLGWIEGHLRRQRWRSALGCVLPDPTTPQLLDSGVDRFGEWAATRIVGGPTVTELTGRAEHLAAFLAVDQVRVTRDPNTAAVAHLRALRTDPLSGPATTYSPPTDTTLVISSKANGNTTATATPPKATPGSPTTPTKTTNTKNASPGKNNDVN